MLSIHFLVDFGTQIAWVRALIYGPGKNIRAIKIFLRHLMYLLTLFSRYLVIKATAFMLWPLCYRIAALVIPKVSSNQTFQRNWRPPFSYQKTKKSPNNIRVLWSRHRSEGKNWKRYVTRLSSPESQWAKIRKKNSWGKPHSLSKC